MPQHFRSLSTSSTSGTAVVRGAVREAGIGISIISIPGISSPGYGG